MNSPTGVVLFDGYCNLCHRAVRFILIRDRYRRFKFASLQSEIALSLLKVCHPPRPVSMVDSVFLIENKTCYTSSDAVLRILKGIGGLWAGFYILMIIPKSIRDSFYAFIARHRVRWFGRSESCLLPRPEYSDRFL